MRLLTSTLALMATTAFAAPLLEERQSATTCGSNSYSSSQVRAAVNSGCNYVSQGGTACSGSCKAIPPPPPLSPPSFLPPAAFCERERGNRKISSQRKGRNGG